MWCDRHFDFGTHRTYLLAIASVFVQVQCLGKQLMRTSLHIIALQHAW